MMCGIVGYTGFSSDLIEKMNSSQFHRGPDEGDSYRYKNTSIGMRRLSIIDLDEGQQPMRNSSNDLCIVFNGEIFNAPELRLQLESEGIHFKTKNSDTEVLLKLYEKYGQNMLDFLNGMFAFVILDQKKDLLLGARDQYGIKPFHYIKTNEFAFASEIKSLKHHPDFTKELDHEAIEDFLSFQAIPAPKTIYKNIKKLPAGHFFTYDLSTKNLEIKKFFNNTFKI